jgi:hypothetical protein
MGIKKAAAGCDGCANSYFNLARRSGANDDEIEAALMDNRNSALEGYLSRRQVLKGIALAAVGTAASVEGLLPLDAAAVSNSFGVDTNTVNCCGMPYSFYIGRFGYQLTQTTSGFNVNAARQAGSYYSYEYWDLGGPNWPGAGSNPYAWGAQQADAAVNSWTNNPNALLVDGLTIFADVEPGEAWDNPTNQGNNQQVLQGWIDQIRNRGPFIPGLYISPGNWNAYFGSGFRTSGAVALWATSCRTCSISCPPASPNCSGTPGQVQTMWSNPVSNLVLGGSQVAVWQYWIGGCAYGGDWDYSNQSCHHQIAAVSSTSTYVCPGCGSGSPCP